MKARCTSGESGPVLCYHGFQEHVDGHLCSFTSWEKGGESYAKPERTRAVHTLPDGDFNTAIGGLSPEPTSAQEGSARQVSYRRSMPWLNALPTICAAERRLSGRRSVITPSCEALATEHWMLNSSSTGSSRTTSI